MNIGPINPQVIAGLSWANDDALVNDSRDDTDVSRMISCHEFYMTMTMSMMIVVWK